MPKHSRKPKDANQLAKYTVDQATDQGYSEAPPKKHPAAAALGTLGGLQGGKARAKRLSKRRRAENR